LFSSRSRHTRFSRDWSSDVCSSDLERFHFLHREFGILDESSPSASNAQRPSASSPRPLRLKKRPLPLAPAIPPSTTPSGGGGKRSDERRVGEGSGAGWALDSWLASP